MRTGKRASNPQRSTTRALRPSDSGKARLGYPEEATRPLPKTIGQVVNDVRRKLMGFS